MAEHAHRNEQQTEHVPVPTVRQTLVRTLPASMMLLIGPPLLTWWLLDVAGRQMDWWWLLALCTWLGLSLLVQRVVQAPRPRLAKRAERRALDQWLTFTAKDGRTPEGPRTRTAAGTLACSGLEAELATAAMAAGMVLALLIAPTRRGPWPLCRCCSPRSASPGPGAAGAT
ncbi:hypothetical protein GCM10011374_02990 [Kocuria dechangensis]|uniref:Uncharacterized protein n=1 Tax=Kocuria dechangensis TaxID=1176249 RepID=A0A917LMT8_9MICC|nr:hypothetical protein [Kocuria dechangensis]GGG44035.1 hypothetical protein GCM10011374_02990 [Kocuria dechangensis]